MDAKNQKQEQVQQWVSFNFYNLFQSINHGYYIQCLLVDFLFYFSIRLLSVLRGHSVFSSTPQRPMTFDFEGFSIPDFIHYIYFPIFILEKEPVFFILNVQC